MQFARLPHWLASGLCLLLLAASCQPAAPASPAATAAGLVSPTSVPLSALPTGLPETATRLFDDFSYASDNEMAANGWIIRSEPGWPGVPGATWSPQDVVLIDDPDQAGNRLVQMTSSTDGTNAGTTQTQLCHQRKYLYGTYAARVRFSDAPASGPDDGPSKPDGDQVVETFYTISPLKAAMDPDYSENDFEYLPNGGWGSPEMTLFATTWETFSPEPNWKADNSSSSIQGSQAGWHILVMQVTRGGVQYSLDGKLFSMHSKRFAPETPMSINFNLWFIRDGLLPYAGLREYIEQIDWVFFQDGPTLTPEDVVSAVEAMRQSATMFVDSVPAQNPPLDSPCNF